jgi:hypothetical protein
MPGRMTWEEEQQYNTNMRDKYGDDWESQSKQEKRDIDSGATKKDTREEWRRLTEDATSEDEWERGRQLAIQEAKDFMKREGFDDEDYERELKKLEAYWDTQAADRLSARIRSQEDALISEQRDIASGRVQGKGTILAAEQLHLAGQTAQSGARGLSGRAATRSRLYGRSADDLRLRGAQAVRTIRDQEKEQAQANVVQMQLAQDKGDLVQAREVEAKNLQAELLSAEEESNVLSVVLGLGGAVLGGVAGFYSPVPGGTLAGVTAGYGIGASIGANV